MHFCTNNNTITRNMFFNGLILSEFAFTILDQKSVQFMFKYSTQYINVPSF